MQSRLHELESTLRDGAVSPADLKPHLLRLSSALKESLQDRNFTAITFVRACAKTVASVKSNSLCGLRFEIQKQAVPYLYAHGSLRDALEAARAMRAAAEASCNTANVRRAENYLGIVQEGLGNIAEAVIHFHRALVMARHCDDRRGECSVLTNLGAALVHGALYHDALPCFDAALRITACDDGSLPHHKAMLHANMAEVWRRLGDGKRAYALAKKAIHYGAEPEDAQSVHSRAIRELTFLQISLEMGDLNGAEQHLKACQHYAARNGAGSAAFSALLAEGLYNVYGADADHGLKQLQHACELSRRLELAYHRADALSALVRAYDRCARPEPALKTLHELLCHTLNRRREALASVTSLELVNAEAAEDARDLQPLMLQEAELRATVAENRVARSAFDSLERLATTASLREDPSGEHGFRVGKLAAVFADKLGWDRQQCLLIEAAARLHDIGKVAIPDEILFSSTVLQHAHQRLLRSHATIGAELLSRSDVFELRLAEHIARFHHENWDGSGYPIGLAGKGIPMSARIVALADVFDAMTHGRPYAHETSIDEALKEIASQSGTKFDPQLTATFIGLIQTLRTRHENLDEFLGQAGGDSTFLQARRSLRSILTH